MFYRLPDDSLLNVTHVRFIKFNRAKGRTEFWFGIAPHDVVSVPGDVRAEVIAASRNEPTTKRR
jgi:hypothetical protein